MFERVVATLRKAEAFVIGVETKHMDTLVRGAKRVEETDPNEHERIMGALIKEGKRLHKKPSEEYD